MVKLVQPGFLLAGLLAHAGASLQRHAELGAAAQRRVGAATRRRRSRWRQGDYAERTSPPILRLHCRGLSCWAGGPQQCGRGCGRVPTRLDPWAQQDWADRPQVVGTRTGTGSRGARASTASPSLPTPAALRTTAAKQNQRHCRVAGMRRQAIPPPTKHTVNIALQQET